MVIVISGLYNVPLSVEEECKDDMEPSQPEASRSDEILITSPYSGQEHHLDLTSVDESSKQLALALQSLKPTTNEYPTQDYAESFNWQEIINQLSPSFAGNQPPSCSDFLVGEFYCIAFYSTLHPNVDTARLHYLDSLAHAEANQSGGLLKYWWQGPPDPTSRRNLATCVWTSWDRAKRAGRLPMHGKAMGATRDSYAKWNVERYYLRIKEGNKWELERITV